MTRLLLLLLALVVAGCAPVAPTAAGEGTFVEEGPFAVPGLPDQRLTIWLPPGYASGERRYPVLYMHDGHNLFDPASANYGKVWAADKAVARLAAQGRIEPHIVVGIWAPGADRYRQYMPQPIANAASPALRRDMAQWSNGKPVVSARYLDWIAAELKPRIDAQYRTLTTPEHTAMAGSSMGGILSCWAIAARPDVFGRAACISSHWPIADPDRVVDRRGEVEALWRDWFAANLGAPQGRKVWMDHGTATLDAHYAPYQQVVDAAFAGAGWREGEDFRSEVYEGAEHEENAWAARLPEVLEWLLADE